MIYTLTCNPSVDYVVQMAEFCPGMVNRAQGEQVFSGGKGINVTVILKNLGIPNRALGFLAGFTGDFIEQDLREQGCQTEFVRLAKGFSRINVKIKGQEESEINGGGPAVDQAAMEALFEKVNSLQKGDMLIISGSIPPSLPKDLYEKILGLLDERGVYAVVDTAGEALMKTLRYEPFLIKPNRQELEELAQSRLFTREEIVAQGRRLQEMGAQNVLISMAAEGAVLLTSDGKVFFGEAPRGTVRNSVGAGDSMVGGFVAGWLKTGSYPAALQWGIAAGSASAFCEGLATGEEIRRLLEAEIRISTEIL
ncbi:1-phosphofructokinase [Anaerotignum sp.]